MFWAWKTRPKPPLPRQASSTKSSRYRECSGKSRSSNALSSAKWLPSLLPFSSVSCSSESVSSRPSSSLSSVLLRSLLEFSVSYKHCINIATYPAVLPRGL